MQSEKFSAGSPLFNPIPGYRSEHYLKHCQFPGYGNRSIPEADRIRRGPHRNWDDNVIWLYTTDYYAGVNKALYTDAEADIIKYGGYIGELRRVIRKRCRGGLKQYMSGTVYRGMTLGEDIVKKLKPGFMFLFPNLLSTSKNKDSAFSGNVRLEIDLDKAVSVTFALHIAHLSAYPEEDEVLFYPYSGFEVLGTTERSGQVTIRLRPYSTLLMEAHDTGMSHGERVRAARERALEIKGKGKGTTEFEGKGKGKGKGRAKGKHVCEGSVKESVVENSPNAIVASADSPFDKLHCATELQPSLFATASILEATCTQIQAVNDSDSFDCVEKSVEVLEQCILPQISECTTTSGIAESSECIDASLHTSQPIIATEHDKKIRKSMKKVREIIKLEELCASGKMLDSMQADKLSGKHVLFMEFADLTQDLSSDSQLVAKGQDVFDVVSSYVSELIEQDKQFRKIGKKVREIIKLEEHSASGKLCDEMQAEKLAGKYSLFVEFADIAKNLPADSDLRVKNHELLMAVNSWLLCHASA